MSSLLLINGSPRGPRSNSMKMLTRIAEGWQRGGGEAPTVLHLAHHDGFERAVQSFSTVDVVLLGMPLYTDSMPGLVKFYIEAIAPRVTAEANPTVGFLVQSGFSEALHSRPLERYLEKLARHLGSTYAGTIVHGGGESLQVMPDEASKKLWELLRTVGEQLARDGRFHEAELGAIAGTECFSAVTAALLSVILKLPITQFYWNSKLKQNGVWDRRFAAPYSRAAQL